jgi:TorA maturation chaperone TorD
MACAFFSRLFLDGPDPGFLRRLREERLLEDWPLPIDTPEARQGLSLMAAFIAGLDPVRQASAACDFSELFVCSEHPVALWESVWTSRERLLFEQPAVEVRRTYAASGLEIAGAGRVPDDHLGLELAFLGCLLGRAAQAAKQGDEPESRRLAEEVRTFLGLHPGRWAGDCLREIERRAATDYFRGASRLCRATLDSLAGLLEAVVAA